MSNAFWFFLGVLAGAWAIFGSMVINAIEQERRSHGCDVRWFDSCPHLVAYRRQKKEK